jgi:N-acetylglucosamine-6-sulfatase
MTQVTTTAGCHKLPRKPRGRVGKLLLGVLALVLFGASAPAASSAYSSGPGGAQKADRPNIILVMVDDQDAAMLNRLPDLPQFSSECTASSMTAMPCLDELVASRGVTFGQHTAEFSLCCPSRATFLTGQHSHNHNVRANGEYDNIDKEHVLPVWLQQAGYTTAFAGKYQGPAFFGFDEPNGVPVGWDQFWAASDVTTGYHSQYNYVLDENGTAVFYGPREEDYMADVVTGKATDFISAQEDDDDAPFFLGVGYPAPHWVFEGLDGEAGTPGTLDNPERLTQGDSYFRVEQNSGPPNPAPRHMDELQRFLEAGLKVPRSPAFNEADVSDKPAFVRRQSPLNETEIARLDRDYAYRLASLLAVDEGIKEVVDALKQADEYDNTYFLFTSDNGWLQGEHRLRTAKVHHYEESTRIPLIISGPGVRRGATQSEATSNVDWAPTILDLAGARPGPGFQLDGMSLTPYLKNPQGHVDRVVFHETFKDKNGYVAARAGRWKYVEYNNGERELYDLSTDPSELTSRHLDPTLVPVMTQLSGLLGRFRTCSGQTGPNPCLVVGVGPPASGQ